MSEAQWARIWSRTGGSTEHIEGTGLAVSETASAREVSIAVGYGYCGGIEFYNDDPVALTAAANTTGRQSQ
jgi:hypothetical protein